jgi:hypothetical protein
MVTAPSALTAASAPIVRGLAVVALDHEGPAAETALQMSGGGAEARPGVAEREVPRCDGAGPPAEPVIGRQIAPSLVAAVVEIE